MVWFSWGIIRDIFNYLRRHLPGPTWWFSSYCFLLFSREILQQSIRVIRQAGCLAHWTRPWSSRECMVIESVVVIRMMAVFIGFLLIFRWWRKDRGLYQTNWKVKFIDLIFDHDCDQPDDKSKNQLNDRSDDQSQTRSENRSDDQSKSQLQTESKNQSKKKVALYHGEQVRVDRIAKKTIREDKTLQTEMCILKSTCHTNLAKFVGACVDPSQVCVLWEHCPRGGLEDLLLRSDMKIDSMMKFSITTDICNGLHHLHSSHIGVHGDMRMSSIVLDSRWVAKITDFGLKGFRKGEKVKKKRTENDLYRNLLWKSCERLRSVMNGEKESITKASDVYSLGIIVNQILCQNMAYAEQLHTLTPKEIVTKVAYPQVGEPLMRPHIPEELQHQSVAMATLSHLVVSCWSEDASRRPSIRRIVKKLKRVVPSMTNNSCSLWDSMTAVKDRYSAKLWRLLRDELDRDTKSQDMCHNIEHVTSRIPVVELKHDDVGKGMIEDVTVCFWNIAHLSSLICQSSPSQAIQMLHDINQYFDDVINNFQVRKVETVCDSSMIVSNCSDPNSNHASIMADLCLSLVSCMSRVAISHKPNDPIQIRIGLNSGPTVVAVIGKSTPRLCVFGDTVRTASFMEFHCLPQRIHISSSTHQQLQDCGRFSMESRHLLHEKNVDAKPSYWLNGHQQEIQESKI